MLSRRTDECENRLFDYITVRSILNTTAEERDEESPLKDNALAARLSEASRDQGMATVLPCMSLECLSYVIYGSSALLPLARKGNLGFTE